MTSDVGGRCAKVFLLIFNIIYLAVGGILLGVGIWFSVEEDAYAFDEVKIIGSSVLGTETFDVAFYIFLAFGVFIFLLGILGLFGAIMENMCLLLIYLVILVCIFIAQITLGVLACVYRDTILDEIDDKLTNLTTRDYYTGTRATNFNSTTDGKALDIIQVRFQCCGVNSWQEYDAANFNGKYGQRVPSSCCSLKADKTWMDSSSSESVINFLQCQQLNRTAGFHDLGCRDATIDWVQEWSIIIIGVALGVACFQIFGFIFAVCLCVAVRREID